MGSAAEERASQRLIRERAFHDDRFADDSARAAAGRYYELAGVALASYESVLDTVGPDSRALEYGAGTGGQGLDMADRGVRVTGIDLSAVAVDKANAKARERGLDHEACHYLEMDAEHLDFPAGTFDLVFGSGILHHLDLEVCLPEVARVLVPDGSAVFFEPMGHNPAINLYRRLTPAMRSSDEHPLLVHDLASAERWFGEVGADFHVLTGFAAVPFRRTGRFAALVDRLDRLDRALFHRLPALARFGWIAVIRLGQPRPDSVA